MKQYSWEADSSSGGQEILCLLQSYYSVLKSLSVGPMQKEEEPEEKIVKEKE
jgi:hypothetical protein